MPIEFLCPSCRRRLRVPENAAGKQALYPECSSTVAVPNIKEDVSQAEPINDGFDLNPTKRSNASLDTNPFSESVDTAKPDGELNPYAAPSVGTFEFQPTQGPNGMQLATLGQRFGGRIVDNLATTFVFIVTVVFAAAFIPKQRPELDWIAGAGAIAALMLIPIINCFLIMRDGRTIGKIIAGTQIVLESTGKPPGFVEGVFLRSWLPTIAMMIPGIGGLAGLADALFIFGEKRQCLHDMIAKTRVVEYQQPTVPTTSPFA